MRVLIAEFTGVSNRGLVQLLRAGGVAVDRRDSGEDVLHSLRHGHHDVVLADLVLPDMEGYELVRRMRAARIDIPVIIQAARARPQARVKAFEMGADDFVTKPCEPDELVARLQALMGRSAGHGQPSLRCGPLQLDVGSRTVLVSGQPVPLTGMEYAILHLLMLHMGVLVSKEAFFAHLYGGMEAPERPTIDVFICGLRKKLAAAGAPSVIGTVWGRGYMMHDATRHPMLATVAVQRRSTFNELLLA